MPVRRLPFGRLPIRRRFNPLNTKLSCWNFNLVNGPILSRITQVSFALLVSNLRPFSPVSSCNCSHSSRSRLKPIKCSDQTQNLSGFCLENLNILQLQDARKTHFPTFSMICTHLNHCYLYVLFISQPQSTNFEQNLTRSLHFIGLTSKVGGAS